MKWQQELAQQQREHFAALVKDGGAGWHPYALDAAEKLVKAEPMIHAGLVAHVEQVIGAKDLPKARKALEWFHKNGAGRAK